MPAITNIVTLNVKPQTCDDFESISESFVARVHLNSDRVFGKLDHIRGTANRPRPFNIIQINTSTNRGHFWLKFPRIFELKYYKLTFNAYFQAKKCSNDFNIFLAFENWHVSKSCCTPRHFDKNSRFDVKTMKIRVNPSK